MASAVARLVDTAEQARALAAHLLDPTRLRPCVVVSTAAGQAEPFVDAGKLVVEVGDLAEVWVLAPGDASRAFARGLPERTQVYGGASRVYPVDLSWRDDPYKSPLRFAYGLADRERVTEALASDALAMAFAAGLVEQQRASTPVIPARGEVIGVVGNRAFVDTDRGMGTIVPELTVPDIAAERLFAKGMRVQGSWDSVEHRLDVSQSLTPLAGLLGGYTVDEQILGRVTRLDDGGCHVELVPGVNVFVPAALALAGTGTRLTTVMSRGEVVRARVITVGGPNGKGWRLSLIDVAFDQPSYAVGLLPGGPPWLALLEPTQDATEFGAPEGDSVAEATPEPALGSIAVGPLDEPTTEFDALRLERDELLDRLAQADRKARSLQGERARLRTRLRETQNSLVAERRRAGALGEAASRTENDGSLFIDPQQQLQFDIYVAWARRIPAAEKSARPLVRHIVGDHFLESWAAVDGIDRSKVVDVIVEVLTGLVHELPGRDSHQLRTDLSGNAPFVTRPDGATCWRVALQQQTPQARRLHYWQLADGSVELSSVRSHDDFRP